MKTTTALPRIGLKSALAAAAVAFVIAPGVQTLHATVAASFTIVNHANSQPLSLYGYEGNVILLDFWAYWCVPCQSAARDIEPNVVQYYRNAGGNNNGVPVQVISVNIDCSSLASENNYITVNGLELVADDCNRVAFSQFDNGYIPQFGVINGTTNSSNYAAWQILYSPYGYATNSTVPTLKSYIESVQTPAPVCTLTNPANGAVIAPANIPLGARLVTNGKLIKKVEFYNGGTLLGSITNTSYRLITNNPTSTITWNTNYTLIWSNVSVGAKSVFARAYYGASSSVDSPAVNFTVAAPVLARLSPLGTNLLLTWTGGSGTYQVQSCTNPFNACWQNCGAVVTCTNMTLVRSNKMSFYRVKCQ